MASTVSIEFNGLDELLKDIRICAREAIPYACASALNSAAFEGRKLWQQEMQRTLTLRNKYTERSVRVEKAKPSRNIEQMQAVLGSVADYMRTTEQGGVERGKKRSKPIPTKAASGEALGGDSPRLKAVRPRNFQKRLTLTSRAGTGKTRKQRNAIALRKAQAKSKKREIVLLEGKSGPILSEVSGKRKLKIQPLWDLSNPSVTIKPHPTFEPTFRKVEDLIPGKMEDAIKTQLKRRGILGY